MKGGVIYCYYFHCHNSDTYHTSYFILHTPYFISLSRASQRNTAEMPRPKTLKPGSTTLRLQTLASLSSPGKTSLLQSIADDITASFITVAQHAAAGHLSEQHTAPLHDVIALIKDTASAQRHALEQKLKRYQRRMRQGQRERRWMRRELGRLVERMRAASV